MNKIKTGISSSFNNDMFFKFKVNIFFFFKGFKPLIKIHIYIENIYFKNTLNNTTEYNNV